MADETNTPQTHAEQMAERQREHDRAAAEAEANRKPGEPAPHSERTNNRAQGSGRENTVVPEHTRERPPPTEESQFGANPKPPLKILNIDGGGNGNGDGVNWMDFSEPVPMELIQAIYDNSKDGPVTIWSRHLAEADFAPLLWNWLLEGDAAWRSRSLSMQLWEPPTEVPPQGGETVNFNPPARPREGQRAQPRATTTQTTAAQQTAQQRTAQQPASERK